MHLCSHSSAHLPHSSIHPYIYLPRSSTQSCPTRPHHQSSTTSVFPSPGSFHPSIYLTYPSTHHIHRPAHLRVPPPLLSSDWLLGGTRAGKPAFQEAQEEGPSVWYQLSSLGRGLRTRATSRATPRVHLTHPCLDRHFLLRWCVTDRLLSLCRDLGEGHRDFSLK